MDFIGKENKTKQILCGNVPIGGGAPISIQSMTNTKTDDIAATVSQILTLQEAGCDIVRVAVPDMESAKAIMQIKKQVQIPVVADIHFDYRLAIASIENGADKIRINPGNIGSADRLQAVVSKAKSAGIPIRIGVNGGSLEKDILNQYGGVTAQGIAQSAIQNVKLVEDMGFDNIVVSIKSSDIQLNYHAHLLAREYIKYPFHIGITEAGTIESGKVKSAAGIGALLLHGIGDTLRVSLTGNPVREVIFAKEILKACGILKEGITLVSCPTCGRCSVNLEPIALEIEQKLSKVKDNYKIAVMGCEVNGPGEAKEADFGIAFGKGKGVIFAKGKILKTVEEKIIIGEFLEVIHGQDHKK